MGFALFCGAFIAALPFFEQIPNESVRGWLVPSSAPTIKLTRSKAGSEITTEVLVTDDLDAKVREAVIDTLTP